jgi:hypothetical protein
MWRTSSWIGIDGLIASYRQRHQRPRQHVRTAAAPGLARSDADTVKTAA